MGTPARAYADTYVPGTEQLGEGEIRVSILGSAPVLILFLLLQRFFISGLTAGSVKG